MHVFIHSFVNTQVEKTNNKTIQYVHMLNKNKIFIENSCLGSYHVECTGSRPITEVKQRRARLVLGWVTAWEYRVF